MTDQVTPGFKPIVLEPLFSSGNTREIWSTHLETLAKWQIVTNGNILPSANETKVRHVLQRHLRLDDPKLDALLDGRRKVIKRGLDRDSAEKYRRRLQAIGLVVNLEAMPADEGPGNASSLSLTPLDGESEYQLARREASTDAPSEPSIKPGEIKCPKCGHIQPKATDCTACGIIVANYRPFESAARSVPSASGPAKSTSPWRMLGLVAIVAIALASLFFLLPDSARVGTSSEAQAQIEALRRARQHPRPEISDLRQMIQDGNYFAAEETIRWLHERTLKNISGEDAYCTTVENLTANNDFTIELMDNWVEGSESAIAYLARGAFLAAAARDARGNDWARNTSEEQFRNQARLSARSKRDFEKALSLDPELIPAHAGFIWLTKSRGIVLDKDRLLADAIRVVPGTLQVSHGLSHVAMGSGLNY